MTVQDMRCMVVERQRSEDGEHKWSVKQCSGSRSKCPGSPVVSKLLVKIQWVQQYFALKVESKGRQVGTDNDVKGWNFRLDQKFKKNTFLHMAQLSHPCSPIFGAQMACRANVRSTRLTHIVVEIGRYTTVVVAAAL